MRRGGRGLRVRRSGWSGPPASTHRTKDAVRNAELAAVPALGAAVALVEHALIDRLRRALAIAPHAREYVAGRADLLRHPLGDLAAIIEQQGDGVCEVE